MVISWLRCTLLFKTNHRYRKKHCIVRVYVGRFNEGIIYFFHFECEVTFESVPVTNQYRAMIVTFLAHGHFVNRNISSFVSRSTLVSCSWLLVWNLCLYFYSANVGLTKTIWHASSCHDNRIKSWFTVLYIKLLNGIGVCVLLQLMHIHSKPVSRLRLSNQRNHRLCHHIVAVRLASISDETLLFMTQFVLPLPLNIRYAHGNRTRKTIGHLDLCSHTNYKLNHCMIRRWLVWDGYVVVSKNRKSTLHS